MGALLQEQEKNGKLIGAICAGILLILKMPRNPASENVVCLCHLLNILANFSNLFLHTGKQCAARGAV